MPATLLKRSTLTGVLMILALTACTLNAGPAVTPTPRATATPNATPTETPQPMAAVVNGEGIPVEEYEAEVQRYKAAQSGLGMTSSDEAARKTVLDDLVNQVLLKQGAEAEGYTVDNASLQSRIDALSEAAGGAQALADWQEAHGYTDADFRSSLRRQMAAAWMRDKIAAGVPTVAEQVHVKQILLYNSDSAASVLAQLQAGADFDTLAAQYDPVTQGELGWFPRGYLLEPVVEEAAFALQPGETSTVLGGEAGYHIIKVIERDPAHPLSPDARLTLQMKALDDWLVQKRADSTIVLNP